MDVGPPHCPSLAGKVSLGSLAGGTPWPQGALTCSLERRVPVLACPGDTTNSLALPPGTLHQPEQSLGTRVCPLQWVSCPPQPCTGHEWPYVPCIHRLGMRH